MPRRPLAQPTCTSSPCYIPSALRMLVWRMPSSLRLQTPTISHPPIYRLCSTRSIGTGVSRACASSSMLSKPARRTSARPTRAIGMHGVGVSMRPLLKSVIIGSRLLFPTAHVTWRCISSGRWSRTYANRCGACATHIVTRHPQRYKYKQLDMSTTTTTAYWFDVDRKAIEGCPAHGRMPRAPTPCEMCVDTRVGAKVRFERGFNFQKCKSVQW